MLLTSAPVAARGIATPALPLDLHVLSLSLAFILSQDQTLRCVYVCLFLFPFKRHPAKADSPLPGGRCLSRSPKRLIGSARTRLKAAGPLSPVVLGILTGDPRNPFLVSHLLVRFPHRKHFNELSFPCPFEPHQ